MIVRNVYYGAYLVDKIYKGDKIIWDVGAKEIYFAEYIVECILGIDEFVNFISVDSTQISRDGLCLVDLEGDTNIEAYDSVQQSYNVTLIFPEDGCKQMIAFPSVLFTYIRECAVQSLSLYGILVAIGALAKHFSDDYVNETALITALAAIGALAKHFSDDYVNETAVTTALAAILTPAEHFSDDYVNETAVIKALAAIATLAEHFSDDWVSETAVIKALAAITTLAKCSNGNVVGVDCDIIGFVAGTNNVLYVKKDSVESENNGEFYSSDPILLQRSDSERLTILEDANMFCYLLPIQTDKNLYIQQVYDAIPSNKNLTII